MLEWQHGWNSWMNKGNEMNACMHAWMKWMNELINYMNEWMDDTKEGRTEGGMDGRKEVNGCMDEMKYEWNEMKWNEIQ